MYAVVGWLIIQLGIALESTLDLPSWFDTLLTVLVLIGFPLAMLFAWAFELTPEGVKRTSAVSPEDSIAADTSRKLDYAILAGLALVVGLLAFQSFGPSSSTKSSTLKIEIPEASIAVLPFADLSPDGSQQYFGDGIAEELLNVFAKMDEMQVAGRTSSFAYRGQNKDLREIGRVLNVAHILEGSIRKSGDKIRVTAQLIKVDDGFHIWSEVYDRDLTDIFAVQDDISREISLALMPHIMGEDAPSSLEAQRTDVSAYQKYLEARDLVRNRTSTDMAQAKTLLNEVLATDASYAPAHALLAQVTLHLASTSGGLGDIPVVEALPIAEALIDNALSIDPQLGEAYASRGMAFSIAGQPDKSIAALTRAVELSPNNLDARMWLAFELKANRRHLDTADTLFDVFDDDPLVGQIGRNLVVHLDAVGQLDRAEIAVERLEDIAPDARATRLARAELLTLNGEVAASTRIVRQIYEDVPDLSNGLRVSENLLYLGAYEDALDYEYFPIFEVWTDLFQGNSGAGAAKMKDLIDASPDDSFYRNEYLLALSENRQDEELVAYFDQTWQDVRTFEKNVYSPYSGIAPHFATLATAFRSVDQPDLLNETLQRWRTSIDLDRAGGRTNLFYEEAQWEVASENHEAAIALLEAGLEGASFYQAWMLNVRVFEPLQDDPTFRAVVSKNMARVNNERISLGLEVLEK